MLVEATYNQGQIKFTKPMQFTNQVFKIKIDIPDRELLAIPAQDTKTILNQKTISSDNKYAMLTQFDEILAPYKPQLIKKSALTSADYKAMWQDHLEEKYFGKQ